MAGGAGGAVEARPVATAPNDAAMEKLERIVRARVDSRRTTGIVAGMVGSNHGTGADVTLERIWNGEVDKGR